MLSGYNRRSMALQRQTMDAIVKVSRENLALAVLWGAIAACALITLLAPKVTTAGAEAGGLGKILAPLVLTAF